MTDHGDGAHGRMVAAEQYADRCRKEAADSSELLRLSITKHLALRSALTDLLDLLRKPHPDQPDGYDLALRDVAHRLHAILEERR